MKKLIGVTPRLLMEDDVEKQFVNTSYLDCLLHYDCNVIMLTLNNPNVEEVLDLCDAFLITGGSDLDPKYYGEENNGSKGIDFRLDVLDKVVVEYAAKTKKPLLGICRGHQSINVFLGGSLIQHMENHRGIKEGHEVVTIKNAYLNFDENILKQIFPSKVNYNLESNLPIEQLFSDEIKYIASAIQRGKLISVNGYLGVGKRLVIQEAFKKLNKRIITIDAILHETKDLVVLDMLAQIWGMSTVKIFSLFSKNDIVAIAEVVGDKYNKKDTIELLTALLNDTYANKRISAQYNVLLCSYIINLLVLHKDDIGFVIYIKNLQFASQEIYDFLIYFAKYVTASSIGCVVSYQEPEYKLQEGRNFIEKLCHIEQYDECSIKLLSKEKAIFYVQKMYPELSYYIVNLIVFQIFRENNFQSTNLSAIY